MILYAATMLLLGYVIVKTIHEGYLNDKWSEDGNPVYGEEIHSTQHKIMLLFILIYTIITMLAYSYFTICFESTIEHYLKPEYVEAFHVLMQGVIYYMSVKFLFLSYGWLVVINHFKQERLASTKPVDFMDIIKF